MPLDPRTPVLVGAGQVRQRVDDPERAQEPLALMTRAAEAAADDAGSRALLSKLDAVFVPRGLWDYSNPGALLKDAFAVGNARTALGPISGSTVQWMLSRMAGAIAAGRSDIGLLVGAEAERSRRRAKARGVALRWTEQSDSEPDERFGGDQLDFGWWEQRYRARPIQAFSMYENALRAHRGEGLEAHRSRVAELWARFARVASTNPHAWIQDAPDAKEIATPGPDNPWVAYPYTKRMVANMVVDLGAAVIVCSLEAARRHGISEDRMVFLQAATDAARRCGVPERLAYHDEPVMGLAGRRALALAGAGPEDIDCVDLYSCFPSSVQIAAAELGFPLDRDLTVTGGLTFAGGPFNSYVLHAIATTMDRLRAAPGTRGFVSSVGGYMSKHAFGVYGTEPNEGGFAHECLDAEADSLATRRGLAEYEGAAQVETYCVLAGSARRSESLLFACLTEAGERSFGISRDPALLEAVTNEELCGLRVRLREGEARLA